jgi:hypothetical protein
MSIVEDGRNLPRVLGRKNVPAEKPWPVGRVLANLPAVRGLGREPSLLPQRTEISVQPDEDVKSHSLQGQLTRHPILPILDRPKPLLSWVKARSPLIPRTKVLGAFGIVDPQYVWPPERQIGGIPKPMSILSGPVHPLHPEINVEW